MITFTKRLWIDLVIGNWKDMALINLAECDEASMSQTFNDMEDGRIALDASISPRK